MTRAPTKGIVKSALPEELFLSRDFKDGLGYPLGEQERSAGQSARTGTLWVGVQIDL